MKTTCLVRKLFSNACADSTISLKRVFFLTRREKSVIICILGAFLIGLGVQEYRTRGMFPGSSFPFFKYNHHSCNF